jgi:DNA-binding transcriptional regulator GbsR (MarR family)
MSAAASPAMRRLIDFLGELGPRWGLPAGACRLHGNLYLVARPVTEGDLAVAVDLADGGLADALKWLADYGLIARTPSGAWRTESDPWELMMRALEERRRREIAPALELLRECRQAAAAEAGATAPSACRSTSCWRWPRTWRPSTCRRGGCRRARCGR